MFDCFRASLRPVIYSACLTLRKLLRDGDGEIERVDNFELNHEISLEEAYKGGEKDWQHPNCLHINRIATTK